MPEEFDQAAGKSIEGNNRSGVLCVPYVAGEQPNRPNMIKLNTNECPYPPAPGVERKAAQMGYNALRLYPNADTEVLVNA